MTVRQLIEELSNFNLEWRVFIEETVSTSYECEYIEESVIVDEISNREEPVVLLGEYR